MTKKKQKKLIRIIIIIFFIIYGLYTEEINETFGLDNTSPTFQEINSNLVVSYLDVGQADSILLQNQNEAMLIDAGNNEDGPLLITYFKENNITDFKYVVGTHPHEDHIGGLDDVINNFEVDTILLPDIITTTKTFIDVLDAIEQNNKTYTVPKIDEEFKLGEATIKVIYTGTDTSDLNNSSIVLKVTFGSTTFLFMGDAEEKVEKVILNSDLQSDVLKVGHHGSKYSTIDSFLNKVNPKYAIISVGKSNSYDHPHQTIIDKFNNHNIEIHRTDKEGTIIITSDGNNLSITSKKTNTNGE